MARLSSQRFGGKPAVKTILPAILLIAGGYALYCYDLTGLLKDYLENRVHPGVFLALMAILPLLGAPINVFLVLVGMKFGIAGGILVSAVLMFLHMAVTYYLVHSFLRDWICRLLQRRKISMPTLVSNYSTWQAVIFMLVPGIPYVLKNNLLALAGFPFAPYIAINWSTQYGMAIPVIVLGGAVMEMNIAILGLAFLLLLAGYLLQHSLRKKFVPKDEGKRESR